MSFGECLDCNLWEYIAEVLDVYTNMRDPLLIPRRFTPHGTSTPLERLLAGGTSDNDRSRAELGVFPE